MKSEQLLATAIKSFQSFREANGFGANVPKNLRSKAVELSKFYKPKHLCEHLQIKSKSLYRWRKASEQKDIQAHKETELDFISLPISNTTATPANPDSQYILKLPNDMELIIKNQPTSELAVLLKSLIQKELV